MAKIKYRSNFETGFAKNLTKRNIPFEYESDTFKYYLKVRKGKCGKCGNENVVEEHTYTPDFKVGSMFLELKGNFIPENRIKMIKVKETNPDLDIRLIFMYNNKLTKTSKSRYSDWCDKHGFKYAFMTLPDEWLYE